MTNMSVGDKHVCNAYQSAVVFATRTVFIHHSMVLWVKVCAGELRTILYTDPGRLSAEPRADPRSCALALSWAIISAF